MSSTSFTHVTNTIVSGSQVLSTLTGNDIISLQYHAAISTCLPLYLEDLGTTVNLTADGLTQAAVSRLLVDGTDLTEATYLLKVGTDSTSQAQTYVRLFDLTTTSKKVILTLQYSGVTLASGDSYVIQLGTEAGGPSNYIKILQDGASAASSKTLYTTASAPLIPGSIRSIEVYASNLTSGSEIVNFNVTTGMDIANAEGPQGPTGAQGVTGPVGPTGPAA